MNRAAIFPPAKGPTGAGARQRPEPWGTIPHGFSRPTLGHPVTRAPGGVMLSEFNFGGIPLRHLPQTAGAGKRGNACHQMPPLRHLVPLQHEGHAPRTRAPASVQLFGCRCSRRLGWPPSATVTIFLRQARSLGMARTISISAPSHAPWRRISSAVTIIPVGSSTTAISTLGCLWRAA